VWWLAPDFPANIRWFQAVILAFGVLLLFLAYYLFEKVFKLEPIHRWLVIGLLVLNPALLSASQWILSEIPYAALSTAALICYETRCRQHGNSRNSLFLLALLSGAGVLLKAHGFVLPLAFAACLSLERRWGPLLTYILSVGSVLLPWWLWAGQFRSESYSPLTQYYVSYQSTLASNHSLSHWAMIIGQNVKYLANTLDHFLLVLVPILPTGSRVPVVLLVFGIGVALVWRRISRALAIYLVLYLSVVLALPFHPYRHLVPILHLFLGVVTLAVLQGFAWVVMHSSQIARLRKRPLCQLLLWLPVGIIFISHTTRILMAFEDKAVLLPDYINFYKSRMSGGGFLETNEWIKRNIPASDRIASAHDTLYFLYTGRLGTRYWFHNPESYFYPDYLRAQANIGDPKVIIQSLKNLKVNWLLREPVAEEIFAEGKAANSLARSIVEGDYPKASLAFGSSDQSHFVYKLQW
jgi:hypothetical protein